MAVTPVGTGTATPEVEDGSDAIWSVVGQLEAEEGEDLSPEQKDVGRRPEVHGIDLDAGTSRPLHDALDRLLVLDRLHQRRPAPVGLHARQQDVGRHRDELALEAGPLRRHGLGDVAVIADPAVDLGAVGHPHETTPALASMVTSVPSGGGAPPSKLTAMRQGVWNSRDTMPICDRGVPERQTTPRSSWKIGARKVAP